MTAVPDQAGLDEIWRLSRKVGALLASRRLTVATAESLTGGRLSAALTAVPGSSAYFLGGVCAYADRVKTGVLGVSVPTLTELGAVSGRCALEMAKGVRSLFSANLAVSSTGVAGPAGGTPLKPVGLCYLTVADASRSATVERRLPGDRLEVAWGAAREALVLLSDFLEDKGAEAGRGPADLPVLPVISARRRWTE